MMYFYGMGVEKVPALYIFFTTFSCVGQVVSHMSHVMCAVVWESVYIIICCLVLEL